MELFLKGEANAYDKIIIEPIIGKSLQHYIKKFHIFLDSAPMQPFSYERF
jgi:hypothetical protein